MKSTNMSIEQYRNIVFFHVDAEALTGSVNGCDCGYGYFRCGYDSSVTSCFLSETCTYANTEKTWDKF